MNCAVLEAMCSISMDMQIVSKVCNLYSQVDCAVGFSIAEKSRYIETDRFNEYPYNWGPLLLNQVGI